MAADPYPCSDPLEQVLHNRESDAGPVYQSDRGSQHLSIRYTERLVEVGAEPSAGGLSDDYDNAITKSVIGVFFV